MLRLGSKNVSKLFLGGRAIANAYLGNKLVWQASQPLPYDAEVEYLESTGTQWIDTLVNPLVSPTVHIGMEFINSADKDYLGNTNLGSVIGSSLFIADFADYKLQYYRYASVYSVAATDVISTGTFHDLVIGKSVYVDSTFTYSSPNTYIYDVSQTNIMLFKSGRGNPASFRCSYFKLYDGEILVRDFIPVRFTNELGQSEGAMYDKVSRQLFRNAGTGQFVIGPDV